VERSSTRRHEPGRPAEADQRLDSAGHQPVRGDHEKGIGVPVHIAAGRARGVEQEGPDAAAEVAQIESRQLRGEIEQSAAVPGVQVEHVDHLNPGQHGTITLRVVLDLGLHHRETPRHLDQESSLSSG